MSTATLYLATSTREGVRKSRGKSRARYEPPCEGRQLLIPRVAPFLLAWRPRTRRPKCASRPPRAAWGIQLDIRWRSPAISAPRRAHRIVGRLAAVILRKTWTLRLERSGFRDLESPDAPDGDLSQRGTPSHLFQPGHSRAAEVLEETREYYQRLARVSWRLSDERRTVGCLSAERDPGDRAIGQALADGRGWDRIRIELGVGQGRVKRVLTQMLTWAKEGDDEET